MPLPPFQNLPIRMFDEPSQIAGVENAIEQLKASAGKEYPLVIGDQSYTNDRPLPTTNPADPSQVLAVFQKASREQAESAITLAAETFESWKLTPAEERAEFLFKAAQALRQRRDQAVATMVLEAGKNWAEADGDLAEAVDFLEFYAREAFRYAGGQVLVPAEG